jgi:hypothetical protein
MFACFISNIISLNDDWLKLVVFFQRVCLAFAFYLYIYLVGIFDKIGPAEGNSGLRTNFKIFSILHDLDKVISGIIDIERIFGPLPINVGKS